MDTGRVEVFDFELRRQLELTKEDMRFADHIIKHALQEKTNSFLDGVGWEGGDDWLRAEFKTYLLYMLRTSLLDGNIRILVRLMDHSIQAKIFYRLDGLKYVDEFNPAFMQAFRKTKCYQSWLTKPHQAVQDLHPGHMYSGQLSISDVKLKISQITQ